MEKKSAVIKRIAITGPESTGKSTLAAQLAAHYQTVWVKEYAREYLEKIDRPYTIEDIVNIAKGQIAAEQDASQSANKILICDTELIVTKIWAEHAFNTYPDWIAENLAKQNYDLYLLTSIDLPWQADPLREHPHLREYFYQLYLQELQMRNACFVEIKGLYEERLKIAIEAIEEVIK